MLTRLEMPRASDTLLRNATIKDASVFRRVFEVASEGLAPWVWAKSVTDVDSIDDIAMRRMRDKLSSAPAGTAIVAEVDGQPAGGVITYDIGGEPEAIEEDTPPVFVPLIELENLAPHTHYVNALAVFPQFQGRGLGRLLLRAAAVNALEGGMSLIAEDANDRAISLYKSEGYVETARRAVVDAPGLSFPGQNWILMIKTN